MKTRGWLVAVILCSCSPVTFLKAQCGTIQTVTYDTVISGVGYNEDPYFFTFPLFDASMGTLTGVNVSSAVSLNYNYDVENTDSVAKTFRHKVYRADDLISPLLPDGFASYSRTFPNALNNPQNSTNYYSHFITGTDSVAGSGTDYADSSITLLNNATIMNVAADPINFIGTGSASFEYYSLINFNVNVGNTLFNTSLSDQITLSVTYTYCDQIVMNPGPERARRSEAEEIKKRLTPNPSHTGNFTVYFDHKTRGDWQVEIFNSNGNLVTRKLFYNALNANVHNDSKLPRGIYIVRAMNLKSQQGFVERLVVK